MNKRARRRAAGKPASPAFAASNPPRELMRMLATPGNDITIPNYGTVLRSEDETLLRKGGARGIRLYDEVRRDGHALSVLNKRALKVIAREWMVEPASDRPIDVAAGELVKRQFKRFGFDRLCRELLGSVLYGYSVAEIEWAVGGGEVFPRKIVGHQRARFVFDLDWRPRLLTHANIRDGEELPDRKFIVHRHDAEGSDPYGRGLGQVLFWHVLFKREGVGFWAHFLEKYASPTPVAKYPFGTPPAEQDKLLRHLLDLVQQGAITVPIGTDVSFLEAARGGSVSYEAWCRYWDEQTSIAVLGETLSTTLNGVGSNAAAETHDEGSSGIADADTDLLSGTLNDSLVKWIVEFNLPGATPPTVWRPRPKNEKAIEDQRAKKAERAKKELDNLFDLAAKGFRPKVGLEAALSDIAGVEIVADAATRSQFAPPPPVDIRAAGLASTALTPQFAAHDDHGIGDITQSLEEAAQPTLDQWISQSRAAVDRAVEAGEPLAAIKDRLLALYPAIDVTPLGELLRPAITLADLSGRADVIDETQ
ncbi:MAG TPA: DUF935 family protein [Ancylobacter sp.]